MRIAQILGFGGLWAYAALAAAAPSAPASIDVTLSPNTVVANYSDTALVSAVVHDANGQPVANQAVLVSASGTNNGITRRSGLTDLSGAFSTPIRSNVAQTKLVTVTAADVTAYASIVFVSGPPSAARCIVTASPKINLVADGISTSLLTASVQDVYANPVANLPISINVSGTENTLSVANGNTSDSGLFMTGLTSTHAETKTVTVTAGSVSANTNVLFIGNSPNATFTQFVVSPNTPLAADQNQAFLLRVYVRDDHNNAIPNYPVAFGIDGKTGRFDATDGFTTTGGVFATSLRSSTIGNKQIYASSGEFSATQVVTFKVGTPRSGTSTVVASPNRVVADNNSTTVVTCTVRDASSNPVPGVPVSLAVNGNRNTLSAQNGNSDAQGEFVVTLASGAAENKTVTMTAGTATARGNVAFVAGAPNATLSRLTINPNTPIAANNSALFTLTATFFDDYTNPIKFLPVHFASTGHNDLIADADTVTSTKGVSYTTLRTTSIGDSTVTVSGGNVTFSSNVTFTLGALSPFASRLTASPNTNITADNNQVATLTATLHDIVGHKLSNQDLTIASNGIGDVLGTTSAMSDANGMFSTTLAATRVGTKTVTLFSGGAKVATQVSFVAGPPSQVTTNVEVSPNNVVADNRSLTTVTTTVLDAFGNGCRNVRVNLAVSDTNSTLALTGGNTVASGVFATNLRSSLASVKTVTATVGGWSVSGNIRFVAGPPNTSLSVLTASPNTGLLANNIDTATLNAALRDAFGNITPNVRVLMSGSAAGNTFSPMTGLTDANGTFSSSVRCSHAAAQRITLSAGTATLNTNVTFSPGPPDGNVSTLELLPYSAVVANGSAAATVTATVKDQWGNPVPNVAATMTSSSGNDTLSAHNGNTTAAGTFVTTVRSTTSGTRTIAFGAGGFTLSVPSIFAAGLPNAARSSVVVDANNVPADNATTVNVTATLMDAYGNAVSNQWVNFSASGSRYQFLPSSGATDPTGAITATLRSSQAGNKVIKAQAGSFSTTTGITFVAGSPNNNTTKVVANPNVSVPANGTNQVALKALVFDVFSNPVGGQAVTFASNGNNDTIANASGTSDANGMYSTTMTSLDVGSKIITLSAGTATATTRVVFVAPHAALAAPADVRLAQAQLPQAPHAQWALADFGAHGPLTAVVLQEGQRGLHTFVAGDDGAFVGADTYPAGALTTLVASGDLNGDGIVDVAAYDSALPSLWLYAGREGGGFAAPQATAAAPGGTALAVADADGDGHAEAYLLCAQGHAVQVLQAAARGAWQAGERVALQRAAQQLAVLPATATLPAQLLVGGRTGVDAYALCGPQGAAPGAPTSIGTGATRWLWAGDVDGDAHMDVIALTSAGDALHVWRGTPSGAWLARSPTWLPNTAVTATVGDVDGDGLRDIVVGHRDGRMWRVSDGAQHIAAIARLAPAADAPLVQIGIVPESERGPMLLVHMGDRRQAPRSSAAPASVK